MSVKEIMQAFDREVVPDEGLMALLATDQDQAEFYRLKTQLLESEVETVSDFVEALREQVFGLASYATDTLADFLQRSFDPRFLRDHGFIVNPRERVTLSDSEDQVLLVDGKAGRTIDVGVINEPNGLLSELTVYAHPNQLIRVDGQLTLFVCGDSRVRVQAVDRCFTSDFCRVEMGKGLVFSTTESQVFSSGWGSWEVYNEPDPYWAHYLTLSDTDADFAWIRSHAEEASYSTLFDWAKGVQQERGYDYDWSTITKDIEGVTLVCDNGVCLTEDRINNRLYLYAQLTEESLLGEIHRHGMPSNASACMRELPRLERQRAFIRAYREEPLPPIQMGNTQGVLRYNKTSDALEVVQPGWGKVLESIPYDPGLSMKEQLRLVMARFSAQRLQRGHNRSV